MENGKPNTSSQEIVLEERHIKLAIKQLLRSTDQSSQESVTYQHDESEVILSSCFLEDAEDSA